MSLLFLYVQEMRDLLKIPEDLKIPQRAWLVTLGIEALYSFIPHQWSIAVVAKCLKEKQKSAWPSNAFI